MLLEHLKELMAYHLVGKKVFQGYPLRVEYFLTDDRGHKILEALAIMQQLGIDFMLQNGMEDTLRETGVVT